MKTAMTDAPRQCPEVNVTQLIDDRPLRRGAVHRRRTRHSDRQLQVDFLLYPGRGDGRGRYIRAACRSLRAQGTADHCGGADRHFHHSDGTGHVRSVVAGLGLGGATPCFIALTSEYAPGRLRAALVTVMWAAFPLGGLTDGLLNSYLIPTVGMARDLLYRRYCTTAHCCDAGVLSARVD